MIKCPQCGTKNRDNSRYCEDCGATLKYDKPVQFARDNDDGTVVLVDSESGSVDAPIIDPSGVSLNSGSAAYSQRIPYEQEGTVGGTRQQSHVLSIIAFVMSLVSLMTCFGFVSIVPLIFGITALRKDRNPDGSANKLAIVAVILSSVGLAISILWFIIALVTEYIDNLLGLTLTESQFYGS